MSKQESYTQAVVELNDDYVATPYTEEVVVRSRLFGSSHQVPWSAIERVAQLRPVLLKELENGGPRYTLVPRPESKAPPLPPDELAIAEERFTRHVKERKGVFYGRSINAAFVWSSTEEGHSYWQRLNGDYEVKSALSELRFELGADLPDAWPVEEGVRVGCQLFPWDRVEELLSKRPAAAAAAVAAEEAGAVVQEAA